MEDSSFTLGIIDNDGKVVKQFNAYGLNEEATLRLVGRVAEGKEQVTLKKGLIALVTDYKQEITEPFEEVPPPPVPTTPPLPSISSANPIAYTTSSLVNTTYENKVLTSNGGYLHGISLNQGGQAIAEEKPKTVLVKLGTTATYLYWGNGVSYVDYALSDTEQVKVVFQIRADGTKYVEIGSKQYVSSYNSTYGTLSWKEGDIVQISIENSELTYKNLTTQETALSSTPVPFIDNPSTTFMTVIQGAGSIEIGSPVA